MMESSKEDADQSDSYSWFLSRCFHDEYRTIPIRQEVLILGRGPDMGFQFCPKTFHYLSRKHCMVQIIDGKPTITDCDSQRGTFVNSKRLDKFSPGRIELKEGDHVGIGHKNDEIQQYFKFHSNILKYRVCRKIPDEESIIVSDGETDASDSPTVLPIASEMPSTESLNQTQTSCESNEIKISLPKATSPMPGPSGLRMSECVSIPMELLRKSSFEEEYDMCVTRLNEDCYESDIGPCSSKFVASEIITVSDDDDDEYADLHHTQQILEEVKNELQDIGCDTISHNICKDTNDQWSFKLKPDIDARQRYKQKTKEYKGKYDSFQKGKDEHRNGSSKKERAENTATKSNDKKQQPKSTKHSTDKENTKRSTETKKKSSHDSSLKISLKRNSNDWVISNANNEEAKKTSKSVDSSTTSEAEDGDRRPTADETVKVKTKPPPPPEQPKYARKRRHSVADWNELGARKPHGTIEIVPPDNHQSTKATFAHRAPLWMTSSSADPKPNAADPKPNAADPKPNAADPKPTAVAPKPTVAIPKPVTAECSHGGQAGDKDPTQNNGKPPLKRRGSIASPEELQALFQKKFKPSKPLPDRVSQYNPISAAAKEQKEQRKNRLIEVNKKNQDRSTVANDDPPAAPIKTGSTKPKVKFTPNNRGMFLTAPIPPPSSRVVSKSRPTLTEESIMCTQSTTLDLLPNEAAAEQVIDTRPKKLTFESVARLSNFERPVPSGSELRKITARRYSVMEPPTYLNQPHMSAISNSATTNLSNAPTGLASSTVTANKTATNSTSSNVSHSSRAVAPYVPLVQRRPLKSILKKGTPKNVDRSVKQKHITFMVNLNKTLLFEKYIVAAPFIVQEHITTNEQELLADILKWSPQWLMNQQSEASRNAPFANEERMMPNVEDYADHASFRKLHTPFLKRELWNEVHASSKSMSFGLVASTTAFRSTKHIDLCEIEFEVSISVSEQQQLAANDFGIMEYHISPQQKCSSFIYIHTQKPSKNGENGHDVSGAHSTRVMRFILYAPGHEQARLGIGQNVVLRPFARIYMCLRRVNALTALKFSPLLCNILTPSFNVTSVLQITKSTNSEIKPHMEPGTLNSCQMKVLSSVLAECLHKELPAISIIQGPPGTGKSRVISHLVLQLMHIARLNGSKMKVLVCAASNTAVDVIVKKILHFKNCSAQTKNFKVVRTGSKNKVDPSCMKVFIDELIQDKIGLGNGRDGLRNTNTAKIVKPVRTKEEIKARMQILNEANIVCTTLGSCSMLASYSLNIQFNVCIIDEATQCTELCTLLPLQYNVSKLVLVGDVHQLPATVLDQQSVKAGFRNSLFSRNHKSYIDMQKMDELKVLTTQYRMHPDICHWPNMYFYQGQLKNAPCTKAQRKDIPLKPYMVISLSYDQELTQAQYEIYNKDEIRFVVGLVKQIVTYCTNHASLAVITPYSRQKEELTQTLRNLKMQHVEVHSIDSVQGKEFDVVVVSLARSNGTGFLDQPERINVAMTRARQCLVLCGNFNSLRNKPVWSSLLADAQKRKVYYQLEEHDADAYGEQMVQNIMQRLRKN